MGNLVSRDILIKFIDQEIGSDPALFHLLFGHLVKHLADIEAVANNQEQLGLLAHKAKTGCHSFGALELEAMLERIENSCKSNDHETLNESIKTVLPLIEFTLSEIQNISKEVLGKASKSA